MHDDGNLRSPLQSSFHSMENANFKLRFIISNCLRGCYNLLQPNMVLEVHLFYSTSLLSFSCSYNCTFINLLFWPQNSAHLLFEHWMPLMFALGFGFQWFFLLQYNQCNSSLLFFKMQNNEFSTLLYLCVSLIPVSVLA